MLIFKILSMEPKEEEKREHIEITDSFEGLVTISTRTGDDRDMYFVSGTVDHAIPGGGDNWNRGQYPFTPTPDGWLRLDQWTANAYVASWQQMDNKCGVEIVPILVNLPHATPCPAQLTVAYAAYRANINKIGFSYTIVGQRAPH
jgi:hypothetical protein